MTREEVEIRRLLIEQLRKDSLATCLGGIVEAMKLCGTPDEQRMAALVHNSIMKAMQ